MKTTIANFQKRHSSDKKLIKRKKNIPIQSFNLRDKNEQKFIVQIFINSKIVVNFKVDKKKSLKQVKLRILQKLRQSKMNISNLIGFQSQKDDYAFDYKFQQQIGEISENIKLRCLFRQTQSCFEGLAKYKVCCCLAIGGFSKVFLVRSKITGKFYAAKFVNKQKTSIINETLLKNEKQINLKLNFPFLVKTEQLIETQQLYIFIMQYCPGGELFFLLKHIRRMLEADARICFIQILLGIQYIHKMGYMYRDLKPENILLDAHGFIKIADFGLAKLHNKKSYSFCGSIQYMAPEIIQGIGHQHHVDFYCLGAILYEMLVGHPPFYDNSSSQEQTKTRILWDNIEFPQALQISDSVKDLIIKLTHKNFKQRLGFFGGCREIMAHPWVGKINRKKYEEKQFQSPFPINLNVMNFDQEQIGQSQRNFQKKIKQLQKSKAKKIMKSNLTSNLFEKAKSRSVKSLNKKTKSPYKQKNVRISSVKKLQKSPYSTIIKNCKLDKIDKIDKTFNNMKNKQKISHNSYLEALRWTETSGKQNKLVSTASILKKKYKCVPFKTITQPNFEHSIQNVQVPPFNNLLISSHSKFVKVQKRF